MNFVWLKVFVGIVCIAGVKVITESIKVDNYILGILISMSFWIVLFIFMDWRNWVTNKEKVW